MVEKQIINRSYCKFTFYRELGFLFSLPEDGDYGAEIVLYTNQFSSDAVRVNRVIAFLYSVSPGCLLRPNKLDRMIHDIVRRRGVDDVQGRCLEAINYAYNRFTKRFYRSVYSGDWSYYLDLKYQYVGNKYIFLSSF